MKRDLNTWQSGTWGSASFVPSDERVSLPEPEPVRPCRVRDNFDLKRDTHILWPVDCGTSSSSSTSTSTSAVHNLWKSFETCDSWWPGENTKQNVSRCVCVCVCGGKFVIVLPCHRSEWAVPALCMSERERERTTASWSGRGRRRASARRVFVEFLFWHLTEDAAATPMRRLSDKICCCCSSLLPPPSPPIPPLIVCACLLCVLSKLSCALVVRFVWPFVFVLRPFLAQPAIISDTRYLLAFLIVRRDNLARKYLYIFPSLHFPYQFAQTPCLPPQSMAATIGSSSGRVLFYRSVHNPKRIACNVDVWYTLCFAVWYGESGETVHNWFPWIAQEIRHFGVSINFRIIGVIKLLNFRVHLGV